MGAHRQERLPGKTGISFLYHHVKLTTSLNRNFPLDTSSLPNCAATAKTWGGCLLVCLGFFFLFFFPLSQFAWRGLTFFNDSILSSSKCQQNGLSHFQAGRSLKLVWKQRTWSIFQLSDNVSCKRPHYSSQYSYNQLYKQVTKYLVEWKMFKSTLFYEDLLWKTRDVSTLYQHFPHS